MIPGIDMDSLLKNDEYFLNEEQFKVLVDNAFFQEERKQKRGKDRFENTLVCNALSIKSSKGLYVLIYKDLDLDTWMDDNGELNISSFVGNYDTVESVKCENGNCVKSFDIVDKNSKKTITKLSRKNW